MNYLVHLLYFLKSEGSYFKRVDVVEADEPTEEITKKQLENINKDISLNFLILRYHLKDGIDEPEGHSIDYKSIFNFSTCCKCTENYKIKL